MNDESALTRSCISEKSLQKGDKTFSIANHNLNFVNVIILHPVYVSYIHVSVMFLCR